MRVRDKRNSARARPRSAANNQQERVILNVYIIQSRVHI